MSYTEVTNYRLVICSHLFSVLQSVLSFATLKKRVRVTYYLMPFSLKFVDIFLACICINAFSIVFSSTKSYLLSIIYLSYHSYINVSLFSVFLGSILLMQSSNIFRMVHAMVYSTMQHWEEIV